MELTELVDKVPSSKLGESRKIIEEDWGMPIEEIISDISPVLSLLPRLVRCTAEP